MENVALQQGKETCYNLDLEEQKTDTVCACKKVLLLKAFAGITGAALLTTFITLTVLATRPHVTGSPSPAASRLESCGPSCPDGWVGYWRKCYYFSEAEGNWTDSQNQCSVLNASLALIESEQDLLFMLRFKVSTDPWIGLRREPGQGWKWANGLEFNNLFVIRGEADCAFLSEDTVSSSRCYTERNWICSTHDAHARGTDTSAEGTLGAPG